MQTSFSALHETGSIEQYMELHSADTANVFVCYPYLKKARSPPPRYVHWSVADPVDGIFIVRLNCPRTWMLSTLKN